MSKKMRQHVQYKLDKKWVIVGAVSGCLALTFDGPTAQASNSGEARMKTAVVANSSATPTNVVSLSGQYDGETDDSKVPVEAAPVVTESVDLTIQNAEKPAVPQPSEQGPTDISSQSVGDPYSESLPTSAERPPLHSESTVSAGNVAEQPIRQGHGKETTTMGASHAVPAVALVRTEVTKPVTVATSTVPATSDIDQWMPNKRLQEVILSALQKFRSENLGSVTKDWQSVTDIAKEDLKLLSEIVATNHRKDTYIDGHTAYSLEGLQYAVNLTTLVLRTEINKISHHVFGDIVDITLLASLSKLTYLDLTGNRIEDVTPLLNLKNVTSLDIGSNHIRDLSPLKAMKLNSCSWDNQLVTLEPIIIDGAKREYHLQIQCITPEGSVLELWAEDDSEVAPLVYTKDEEFRYRVLFTGGVANPDGQGGLYYTNIRDPEEGFDVYPWPDENTDDCINTIEYVPYKYALTGMYGIGVDPNFTVIQPYTLSHPAAAITVHYQDQEGQAIADDVVLPQGLVGASYTTQAADVPGYTLITTPENATGTYGDDPIDVTYVYALAEKPGGHQPGLPEIPSVSQPDTDLDHSSSNHSSGSGAVTPETPDTSSPGDQSEPVATGDVELPAASLEQSTSGASDTSVSPMHPVNGQPAQLAVVTGSAAQLTEPTTPATAASSGKTSLPQTGERTRSPLWGVVLLTGLLGLLKIRKRVE